MFNGNTYDFVIHLALMFLWCFHVVPAHGRFISAILLNAKFATETFIVICEKIQEVSFDRMMITL